jgi:hypothetical protein
MRFRTMVAIAVLLACSLSGPLWAQATGRLSGLVEDATKAVIPGATVSLVISGGTEPVLTAVTTDSGLFRMIGVPAGTYDVIIEATGFRKLTHRGVVVTPGQETAMNAIKMEVGGTSETVEVVASALAVQTTTAEIAVTITNSQVQALPVLDRSPLQFIATQAGVNSSTINGVRTTSSAVTVDGINIQDNYIRSNSLSFIPEMLLTDQISEMTIQIGNTNVAYGGGASHVVFVTPSGNNRMRGSAYYQNRNSALASNSWFNNQSNTPISRENLTFIGFTLGGPIMKDKLFYYGNYEAYRDHFQSNVTRTLLTSDARQGIFTYLDSAKQMQKKNVLQAAGISMDPFIQEVLKQVPGPEKINDYNTGDSSASLLRNTGGYRYQMRDNRLQDHVTTRIDYPMSTRNTLSGSYIYNTDWIDRPDQGSDYNVASPVINKDHAHFVSLGWRWSAARLTNELRGGFNLAPIIFENENTSKFPKYFISGTVFTYPLNSFRTQGRNTNTYNINDNASYVWGKHGLQFGFQTQLIRVEAYNEAGTIPTYTLGIGTGNTGLTAAQLPGISSTDLTAANNLLATLGGYITSDSQSFNITSRTSGFVSGAQQSRNYRYGFYAGYVGDAWKVTPRLTLNIGTRYEIWPVLDERDGLVLMPVVPSGTSAIATLQSNATLDFAGNAAGRPFYNSDKNNFAPNIGIAWDPFGKGKTSVRSAYSISYINDDAISNITGTLGNAGLTQAVSATALSGRISSGLPAIPNPTYKVPRTVQDNNLASPTANVAMPDPNLRTSYVQQWSFGIQHEWRGFVFEVRYNASHGTKLLRVLDMNQVIIKENGFLDDFLRAQNNGNLARAATGVFNPNYNAAIAGSQPLTIFPLLSSGGQLNSSTIRNYIDQGQVGQLAYTYQSTRATGTFGSFFPNPYAISANMETNYSNSTYNSGVFEVRSRLKGGLQFQANYVYSKALTDGTGAMLDNKRPQLEKSRASFDRTHNIKANAVYRLPFGEGHRLDMAGNPVLKHVLSGWDLSGILNWGSGSPFSITAGGYGTLNRGGQSGNMTCDTSLTKEQLDQFFEFRMTPTGPYFMPTSAVYADGRGVAPSGSQPFTGQVFFLPTAGNVGAMQRSWFSGLWSVSLSMAASKQFRITERHTLEFRTDASGVLNHPTWGNPQGSVTSTNFGKITSAGGRRQIQFALRYKF